jgi:UDPglucose 6-dehydrogenase
MNLAVIGTGYVGLVAGACFAEMGNQVVCVDMDAEKVEDLRNGVIPIYEPGLEALVSNNIREGRLAFSPSLGEAASVSDIFFIAVGTPSGEDGSADLRHVLDAAREIGRLITRPAVVVNKSTVPVGTAGMVRQAIEKELAARGISLDLDVASNPEFLKEGAAVDDFMRPDRIIIGTTSDRTCELLREIYAPFTRSHERIIFMSPRAAEMTKYAANAMLATRISFINEIAGFCERMGVDVESVRRGIGSDSRIGYSFIYPGCGYGGSCLPKDVNALLHMAGEAGFEPLVLRAVRERNEAQKRTLFQKISAHFRGGLGGMRFGLWGLSFKPGTDDMREAASVVLLRELVGAGASVRAFDPAAMEAARRVLPVEWFDAGRVVFVEGQYEALEGVDAMVLVTEWKSFRHPDFTRMKSLMKSPVIFDGRNQYDPALLARAGFKYFGMGRGEGPSWA